MTEPLLIHRQLLVVYRIHRAKATIVPYEAKHINFGEQRLSFACAQHFIVSGCGTEHVPKEIRKLFSKLVAKM